MNYYTEEEISNNPWRCPCCGLRFSEKQDLQIHGREIKTCGSYMFEGLIAVQEMVAGYKNAVERWEAKNPRNMFNKL